MTVVTRGDETIGLLEKTVFEQDEIDGITYFYNKCEGFRPRFYISFVSQFDSINEAQKTKLLADLYLDGTDKGTINHRNSDSLKRAFIKYRARMPNIHTINLHQRLFLNIPLIIEPKKKGVESLKGITGLVYDILKNPKVKDKTKRTKLFEQVRQENIEYITDRFRHHGYMSSSLFYDIFFPKTHTIDDGKELELVKKATYKEAEAAFNRVLSNSYPVVLYCGDQKLNQLSSILNPFISEFTSILKYNEPSPPEIYDMEIKDKELHIIGQSEVMHYKKAYPLNKGPEQKGHRAALFLLNSMLGSDSTSLLSMEARAKHKLVYHISSVYEPHNNLFLIETECEPSKYRAIDKIASESVAGFFDGKLTRWLFHKGKEKALGELILSSGGSIISCEHPSFRIKHAQAKHITNTASFNLPDTYKHLAAISCKEADEILRKYLNPAISQTFTYSKDGIQ